MNVGNRNIDNANGQQAKRDTQIQGSFRELELVVEELMKSWSNHRSKIESVLRLEPSAVNEVGKDNTGSSVALAERLNNNVKSLRQLLANIVVCTEQVEL